MNARSSSNSALRGNLKEKKMASKRVVKAIIFSAVFGAFIVATYETFFWFTHVYENDARVETDLSQISSQVNGKIEKILVIEGQSVKIGEPLVKLVNSDISLRIKALKTDLELKKAEKLKLISEKIAFETELLSKLKTQKEKIKTIKMEQGAIEDRLELAKKNIKRVEFLFQKDLVAEEKMNLEKDKFLVLKGDLAIKSAQITVAKKELLELIAKQKQTDVIDEKIKILDVEYSRIVDSINLQKIELGYRLLRSPINGVIGRIHKFRGEYVEDGVNVVTLHDPSQFWIEAYVDESQIRHVVIGKKVLIDLEAFPFQNFFGVVSHVGNLTTAQTGLKTRTSASSFGSGIERVPVRIKMENPPKNLTPGMQASVNIRIYDGIKLW